MKMAILQVTPDFVRRLLQLPDGTIITGVRESFLRPGVLEVKIEGAGWEVSEGDIITIAPPGVFNSDGLIDWHLP